MTYLLPYEVHDKENDIQFIHTKPNIMTKNILPGSFMVFQVIGFWKPIHWVRPWLDYVYKTHMFISFFFIYSFSITGIVGLIHSNNNIVDTTNDCFVLLSIIAICGKTANVVRCRKTIIWILETFTNDPCTPRNKDEEAIQNSMDRFIWINTLIYGGLTEVTVFMITIGTLFQDIPIGTLPFNTYIPWDYSQGFMYWFAYCYQVISVILSANADIGYDTLVPGMIMQICAKLHILSYRMRNLSNQLKQNTLIDDHHYKYGVIELKMEKQLVADCVKYHILIFKVSKVINSTFSFIIFIQCSISSIVLCVSVYVIANVKFFSSQCTGILLYLCCMLMEIFILYAAGNEVTFASESVSAAIYATNWTNLHRSTVKSLIIVMRRALRPIIFTSGFLVTLSLNSFKSLLKISYSTFNLLQRTS